MSTQSKIFHLFFPLGLAIGLLSLLLAAFTASAQAATNTLAANSVDARVVITVNLPNGAGLEPYAMAYNASNGYVYVTNNNTNDVSVVNGTQLVARVPAGTGPLDVIYNSSNGRIYVANEDSDNVSVINGTNKELDIAVGNRPVNLAYNPQNGYVYVMN